MVARRLEGIPILRGAAAPTVRTRPREITSLTGMRFIAAALVLLHHATMYLAPLPLLTPLAALGYVGVTFFLVLSGFVLTWSTSPSTTRRRFYGRRVARIAPTYVATTVVGLVLCLLTGRPTGLGPTLAALTATQAWFPSPAYTERLNVVSWSISDEAFFYAVLPLVLVAWAGLSRRAIVRGLVVLVAAMLVVIGVVHEVLPAAIGDNVVYKLPLIRAGEFLIGVLLARLVRSGWRSPITARAAGWLTVAVYLCLTVGLDHLGRLAVVRFVPDLVMLVPLALLVASSASESEASAESASTVGWLRSPVMVRLGRASFQLYMTHFLLILVLLQALPASYGRGVQVVVLAGFAAAAIGLSLVTFRRFEHPLERILRRRLG